MQHEQDLTPAQREFELGLRTLAARPGQMDAIAAAFAAGQRSQNRSLRIWRSATALLLLIAGTSFLVPPGRTLNPAPIIRSVPVAADSSLPPAPQVSDQSLMILQQAVSRRGVDSLPESRLPIIRSMMSNETL
jgi:hypothetical protein